MIPYAPYPLNLVRDWFHRRRWWVRLVLAVLLVPWFGYFAYTRWTARPAIAYSPRDPLFDFDPAVSIPDPAVDRTPEMVAAINALPVFPTLSVPTVAPAGMEWVDGRTLAARRDGRPPPEATGPTLAPLFDFYAALEDEWTPKTRYVLGQIVAYLELSATQATIERIIALCDKPFCLAQSGLFAGLVLERPKQVVRLLMARARYELVEKHDFDRAFRLLEASLNVVAGIEDDEAESCVLSGAGLRVFVLREASLWPEEFRLTRSQTRQLQDLASRDPHEPMQQVRAAIRADRRLSRCNISEAYTKDSHGNGWFVPAYWHPDLPGSAPARLLNLFSPFFNDRRSAQDIADITWTRMADRFCNPDPRDAGRIPWGESMMQSPWPSMRHPEWRPALLNLRVSSSYVMSHFFNLLRRCRAGADGAIIVMALSAYRIEHGRYPTSLSGLVSEYLAALPMDPFSDQPLRYKLDAQKGYLLYSVGDNGWDDNGVRLDWPPRQLDYVIDHDRSPALGDEWFLVPIGGVTPGAGNGR